MWEWGAHANGAPTRWHGAMTAEHAEATEEREKKKTQGGRQKHVPPARLGGALAEQSLQLRDAVLGVRKEVRLHLRQAAETGA